MAGLALCVSLAAFAEEIIYQSPSEFLESGLPGCEQKTLWLKRDVKDRIEALIERPWQGARVRYCQKGDSTAWILDEIGKTEPITSGVIVDQGQVAQVRVLVFRESRGSEVHRDAFTRQYQDAVLVDDGGLDRRIDGITGATLSVWAVTRQVKLALLLDEVAREGSRDG